MVIFVAIEFIIWRLSQLNRALDDEIDVVGRFVLLINDFLFFVNVRVYVPNDLMEFYLSEAFEDGALSEGFAKEHRGRFLKEFGVNY